MSGWTNSIFEGQIDQWKEVPAMSLRSQFGLRGKSFDTRLERGFYPRGGSVPLGLGTGKWCDSGFKEIYLKEGWGGFREATGVRVTIWGLMVTASLGGPGEKRKEGWEVVKRTGQCPSWVPRRGRGWREAGPFGSTREVRQWGGRLSVCVTVTQPASQGQGWYWDSFLSQDLRLRLNVSLVPRMEDTKASVPHLLGFWPCFFL